MKRVSSLIALCLVLLVATVAQAGPLQRLHDHRQVKLEHKQARHDRVQGRVEHRGSKMAARPLAVARGPACASGSCNLPSQAPPIRLPVFAPKK